uniref:Uncharacterized protein n=1 Tax=Anguilla anguilla TaxID=7936 RepID=A0A0E9UJV1_ANGAN
MTLTFFVCHVRSYRGSAGEVAELNVK